MKLILLNSDIILDWNTLSIKRQRVEMREFIADMPHITLYSDYDYQSNLDL